MANVTIAEAAARLLIAEADIEALADEGLLTLERTSDHTYVGLDGIEALVGSMPRSLREKMGNHSWSIARSVRQEVSAEVNARFTARLGPLLDRAEQAVRLLERVHVQHEPHVDIFGDQRGAVAGFILFARIISLLHSALALLRSAVPAETFLLFRPIWEATLLVRYFTLSEKRGENASDVQRWFQKEQSPKPFAVREYLSQHLGLPIQGLRETYAAYSKAIHLTYGSVMESYRSVSMSGFLGERSERLGFDYHETSMMRDIVALYFTFEQLVLGALMAIRGPCALVAPLDEAEAQNLEGEIEFYRLDFEERLRRISPAG